MVDQEDLRLSIHRRSRPGPTTHYIRTTPMIAVSGDPVRFGSGVFRVFSGVEAIELEAALKKRNVFVRHAPDRDTYAKKAANFAGQSVLVLESPSSQKTSADVMRRRADRLERLLLLGATHAQPRKKFHRHFSGRGLGTGTTDLYLNAGPYDLSTKTKPGALHRPVSLDSATARRLRRLGLDSLVHALIEPENDACTRARAALDWLWESRLEQYRPAAYVKTTIGFETLFVYGENEPLRRAIADRLAFLLGRTAEQRAAIAKFAKSLYDVRSAVVHGGTRKVSGSDADLDRADRILLLAALALAHNAERAASTDALRQWFEDLRWSMTTTAPELPFSTASLSRALR